MWVGREASRLNKEACIQAICQGLTDPAAVRRVIADLSDFERAGLGLLKRYGQSAPTEVLATELVMLGLPFEDHRAHHASWSTRGGADYRALNCLLHRGIAMLLGSNQGYGGSTVDLYVDDYHYSPTVFAEPCLLEHVTLVPPISLPLGPIAEVEPGMAKQPAEVVLRLIAMVETLRKMGRIPLTSKGRPTRPFLSKLTKMLGWEAALATDALAPLPDATLFFFWLLAGLGFYQPLSDGTGMDLTPETTAFFEASYEAQAARWVRAYRTLTGWVEHRPESVWGDDTEAWYFNKFIGLRAALLLALAALPEAAAWYRMADLSAGIYSRLGEHFSLGYLPHFYPL
ncbi:MAG TPA: hypothetical protein VLQ80_15905, partial [Candidatus Saccharimonadia bacterium]|nr:hypothetical protein [Candidatus Saccharimonadia bacterium]